MAKRKHAHKKHVHKKYEEEGFGMKAAKGIGKGEKRGLVGKGFSGRKTARNKLWFAG